MKDNYVWYTLGVTPQRSVFYFGVGGSPTVPPTVLPRRDGPQRTLCRSRGLFPVNLYFKDGNTQLHTQLRPLPQFFGGVGETRKEESFSENLVERVTEGFEVGEHPRGP